MAATSTRCAPSMKASSGLDVHSELPGKFVFFRMAEQMLLVFNPDLTATQKTEDGPPPHGAQGPGHVCFRCAEGDLERWRRPISWRRVWPSKSCSTGPQGGRSVYFRDPAGNSLEFSDGTLWGIKPMRSLANREDRDRHPQQGQARGVLRTAEALWRRRRLGG